MSILHIVLFSIYVLTIIHFSLVNGFPNKVVHEAEYGDLIVFLHCTLVAPRTDLTLVKNEHLKDIIAQFLMINRQLDMDSRRDDIVDMDM